ncbi:uncharacterized protein LOC111349652 [Spodoptera litura]|uniref:Uncharacterized protein LOC111349652 n=1 Tax=Spodoptera litura TaxID=69820 RepID=A0A9J7DUM6_SPOLT|nr:uncharacterized protein LOC111349652 [Spodoptera litura]
MSFLSVKIYYGPCNTFDNCMHKPQFLNGLREYLIKLGYRVQLRPVRFLNYCMIEMCGHEVWRGNIKNFKFNTPFDQDPVCKRAVEAVITSSVKFRRARTYLWFWSLIDHELFKRTGYGPMDNWPGTVESVEYSDIKECLKCCNIIATQRLHDSNVNISK